MECIYLWKNGSPVPGNAERCPRILHALRNAPLARVPNRSPSILFSLLEPGAHIPPHNGLVNTRLICHLPLVVPGPNRFRVGNEVRPWVEGRAWAFDDTIEHEAWNDSDRTRVILLFDIWRPELTDEERQAGRRSVRIDRCLQWDETGLGDLIDGHAPWQEPKQASGDPGGDGAGGAPAGHGAGRGGGCAARRAARVRKQGGRFGPTALLRRDGRRSAQGGCTDADRCGGCGSRGCPCRACR
jgi:hypothetical protein